MLPAEGDFYAIPLLLCASTKAVREAVCSAIRYGDMPIIPAIGDKIEYGYPAIPAMVVDREVRFHGGSPDNQINIILFVKERSR